MDEIAGLVLAAGGGRRLGGRPKALLRLASGQTLVERAVDTLRTGGCARVYAVIGAAATAVAPLVTRAGATAVTNPAWETGMGSSLRTGLSSVTAAGSGTAVVIMLVDQPGIDATAVARLLAAHRAGAEVAIATYGGKRAHPVLIAHRLWSSVAALADGDVGARRFLAAHPELVVEVPCEGDPHDIDLPDDLARLQ